MIILGIAGKKNHGKDTVGELLAKEFGKAYVCERLAFADEVKRELAELTGGNVKKINENKKHPWLRKILQYLGTEVARSENDLIWIERLAGRVEELQKAETKDRRVLVYVTDVRFINEAQYIWKQGGLLLKVTRKGLDTNDTHASEVELDKILPDFTIQNDSGLTRLAFEVRCVAAFIREKLKL